MVGRLFCLYGCTDLGYWRTLGMADPDPALSDHLAGQGYGYHVNYLLGKYNADIKKPPIGRLFISSCAKIILRKPRDF